MKKTITIEPQRLIIDGKLDADPTRRTIPAKTYTQMVYDEDSGGLVECHCTIKERNFLIYGVASGGYDDKPLSRIDCIDWKGSAFSARRGDRLELFGYFETCTYTYEYGDPLTIRQFVVEGSRMILNLENRQQIA